MAKMTLRAGIAGAEAYILTRFIKLEQALPHKDHRSNAILDSQFEDHKKKMLFCFCYPGHTIFDPLLNGLYRWVKITKEGNSSFYFEDARALEEQLSDSTAREPKIKWKNLVAKKMLYKDINEVRVPINSREITLQEIYCMHPEYAEYWYKMFSF